MPLSLRFDPDTEIVRITATGKVNGPEICCMLGDLYSDYRFRTGMTVLWDFRLARAPLSVREIHMVVHTGKVGSQVRGAGKTGVLVSTVLEYGLARMLQTYAEDLPADIEVFRDAAEAERWLFERNRDASWAGDFGSS